MRLLTTLALVFTALTIIASPCSAEVKTFTQTVRQPFSGTMSPDEARTIALSKAKRTALEKAGTYMESITLIRKNQVAKDDITALASGVLSTEILEERRYASGETFGVEVKVRVKVDTAVLEKKVEQSWQVKNSKSAAAEIVQQALYIRSHPQKFEDLSQNVPKVLALLSKAINIDPDNAEAFSTRGFIYLWDKGAPEMAVADFTQALRLVPDNVDALVSRSDAYLAQNNFLEAIADCDHAQQLAPNKAVVYINRADAYRRLGKPQDAIKDYTTALGLENEDTEIAFRGWVAPAKMVLYYYRAICYTVLGNFSQVIEDCSQALARDRQWDVRLTADILFCRGTAYNSLKEYSEAIEDLTHCIELDPSSNKELATAYYFRANAFCGLKKYQEVVDDCSKSIALEPDFADIYILRGLASLALGDEVHFCEDARTACRYGNCRMLTPQCAPADTKTSLE